MLLNFEYAVDEHPNSYLIVFHFLNQRLVIKNCGSFSDTIERELYT